MRGIVQQARAVVPFALGTFMVPKPTDVFWHTEYEVSVFAGLGSRTVSKCRVASFCCRFADAC